MGRRRLYPGNLICMYNSTRGRSDLDLCDCSILLDGARHAQNTIFLDSQPSNACI